MLNKKLIAIILAVIMLTSALTGCGKADANATIYYNITNPPENIDPQLASSDSELLFVRNLFEGLLRLDENGEIVPAVAESYTTDDLTYTFNISKSATWSNGDEITANDFVFAFRRAVDPEVACPFKIKFLSILNAEQIIYNGVSKEYLGVKAIDNYTLEITLSYNDQNFLYNLTTSAFMPCNEEFFNSCFGKYGLTKSTVLTNGSYELKKWNTEEFAARLYKSASYFGKFPAKNGAVFLSDGSESNSAELLQNTSVDISPVTLTEAENLPPKKFQTVQFENVCWVLKISKDLPFDLRKSLMTSIDRVGYTGDLGIGFSVANSFFPSSIVSENIDKNGIPVYDLNTAKELFKNSVNSYEDKKLPSTTLTFYQDDGINNVINDIVGHWQKNLGAYLNIQPITSLEQVEQILNTDTEAISIFPVYITDRDFNAYVYKLGITDNKKTPAAVQAELTSNFTLNPIAFENSVFAYSSNLTNVNASIGNGIFDFSFFTKTK